MALADPRRHRRRRAHVRRRDGPGTQAQSDALEAAVLFALAGGAILVATARSGGVPRLGHAELGLDTLGVGFTLGIGTDLVVAYGCARTARLAGPLEVTAIRPARRRS